jgi:hypothetical protein
MGWTLCTALYGCERVVAVCDNQAMRGTVGCLCPMLPHAFVGECCAMLGDAGQGPTHLQCWGSECGPLPVCVLASGGGCHVKCPQLRAVEHGATVAGVQ